MPALDEPTLRHLYLTELLTEKEIATKVGTYQVAINKLRRKWGIPTMGKSGRAAKALGALAQAQVDVLVGTLLGDGSLGATSAASARLLVGHQAKQRPYCGWKADLFEPFTSSRYPLVWKHKATGKEFDGWGFATHSCPQFRSWYDLFYPAPERVKVFPENLAELLTPLALAVWYMDDGTGGVGSFPRFSFGLGRTSRKRAVAALRGLGLAPVVYGTGGDQAIVCRNRHGFNQLVAPYLHPCMQYKLTVETPRQVGDRNARRLTPDTAQELYTNGATVPEIALYYGVGTSTVGRRLAKAGGRVQRATKPADYMALAAGAVSQGWWLGATKAEQLAKVEGIVGLLLGTPFPYTPVLGQAASAKDFGNLLRVAGHLSDAGEIRPRSYAGLQVCGPHFPNRYRAQYKGGPSAWELWHTARGLRAATKFQLKYGNPVLPDRVLKAICGNVRTPTNFRPAAAKYIYNRYAKAGQQVWDPCAGYGGRLLGAVAAGVVYYGTDVDPETVDGGNRLAAAVGAAGTAQVVLCPAEVATPPQGCQLVFTSPPYYAQEQYSGGKQSHQQYNTYQKWLAGFLRPILATAYRCLVAGGHLVLNIADVKDSEGDWPLVADTRRLAVAQGFTYDTTHRYPIGSLGPKRGGYEPVLVFQKPAHSP